MLFGRRVGELHSSDGEVCKSAGARCDCEATAAQFASMDERPGQNSVCQETVPDSLYEAGSAKK